MAIRVQDPDREVIEQVRQGEAEAFEQLVIRYQRRIFVLAYRFIHNEEEAADLTQEIFIRVWEKLHTFRGEAKFSTWLMQLAGNHCKNRLKYLKRRRFQQHESLYAPNRNGEGIARQFPDPSKGPEELVSEAKMRELIRKKLDELPEEQRVVLIMRDIEDLDYEEIAAATGVPLGTIKSRIHRGRVELARKLKSALARERV